MPYHRKNTKNLLETASREANDVTFFFGSNGLVNNADKAAVLYNGKGKSEVITVENVGYTSCVSLTSFDTIVGFIKGFTVALS